MTCIDTAWLDARIAATKATIIAYEGAIDALESGTLSYTLDTGQTRQSVTKQQVGSLKNLLAYYENRLATLCARRNGAGLHVTPGH